MQSISDFFGLIGSATLSHFMPITMLVISLLVTWPTFAGVLGTYEDMGTMQKECGLKPTSHEISQCYQQRFKKMEARLKVVNEYTKNVALPYHGVNL